MPRSPCSGLTRRWCSHLAGRPIRQLRISIRRQADNCLRSIADTGGGIAEQHLAHIFDPFYSTQPVGAGLGLAVSYGIVRELGGSLEASNTREVKLAAAPNP